jgi:hydrogenase expression/formation protein HypE
MTDVRSAQDEVLERLERMRKRRPRFTDDHITMAHGAGGKATRQLVEGLFVPMLDNPALAELGDAGVVEVAGSRLALTTDSFVVRPLRFPGGSIGELCVNGTVNDLAVAGATPLALSVSLVLEEGLPAEIVREETDAIARAAREAGVVVAAGDTKVVERGKADGMYATTAGIGLLREGAGLSPRHAAPGDKVVLSGTIGDHGTAIMLARGELELDAEVESDTRPLHRLAAAVLDRCGDAVRCMRDPTRGGLATVLNEIAMTAEVGVIVDEEAVPVRPQVAGACEILGIDPLYVANEGKLAAFVAPEAADAALEAMRSLPEGRDARIVGEVSDEPAGRVLGRTGFGGHRMIDVLVGDPLPRIC